MGKKTTFKYIDIFAGCGGLSLGFHNACWNGLFAIEKNQMAFETLQHNLIDKKNHFDWPIWLDVKEHDINDILKNHRQNIGKLKGHIDLVAGGPPCQGFSTAGRRNKNDERNILVHSYVKFISLIMPKVLFFENVRGFTAGFKENDCRDMAYSEKVGNDLRELGYNVHSQIIDFSEYGIPQKRKRFILVGMLEGDPKDFFLSLYNNRKSFLKSKGLNVFVTAKEAISDLEKIHGQIPSPDSRNFYSGIYGRSISAYQQYMKNNILDKVPDSHRFPNHRPKTLEKFHYILGKCKKGQNLDDATKSKFSLNKKCTIPIDGDSQCPTLTTLPDDYIHYSEPRILTVREYARIQSFNDWFEFKGKYTTGGKNRVHEVPRYSQIGNAIPPLFVELVGQTLKEYITN
jgi:DNA (cytosine-5)-methyltransferase 1